MDINEMIEIAKKASKNAWIPYTDYMTGVALLTSNGKIYSGCNIQNHGIQAICGERVTFAKAISEGEREFKSIVIVGKKSDDKYYKETLPCGYCRQFMSEFCKPNFEIYTYDEEKNKVNKYTLQDLLPYAFSI